MTVAVTRMDLGAADLRGAAARCKDAAASRRMLALALVLEGCNRKDFADLVAALIPEHARGKPVELWWQDEARIDQQGSLTYVWADAGTRSRAPRDQAGLAAHEGAERQQLVAVRHEGRGMLARTNDTAVSYA